MTKKQMEVTTVIGCSNNCAYCPQKKLIAAYSARGGPRVMSFDVFKECVNELPKDVIIMFSGMAEPFLNPACIEMVEYACRGGWRVSIFTTTVGMRSDTFSRLRELELLDFVVHLPSTSKDMAIDISSVYLKRIEESRDIFNVKYVYFGELEPVLAGIVSGKNVVRGRATSRADNLDLSGLDYVQVREGFRDRAPSMCGSCGDELKQNILMPNGDVILCCMDYGMKHVLGNLLTQSYESLFEGMEYRGVVAGLACSSENILCANCANRRPSTLAWRLRRRFFDSVRATNAYRVLSAWGWIRW